MISIHESGNRRVQVMIALFGARRMHVSASQYFFARAVDSQKRTSEQVIYDLGSAAETRAAMQEMAAAWKATPGAAKVLQAAYLSQNANVDRSLLDRASSGPANYNDAHQRFHPFARQAVAQHRLYDVFLIDRDGNVVYTYAKEPDFASNLKSSSTALAKAYEKSLNAPEEPVLTDVEPYEPSNWASAKFLTRGIVDSREGVLGVLGFQVPRSYSQSTAIVRRSTTWCHRRACFPAGARARLEGSEREGRVRGGEKGRPQCDGHSVDHPQ